MPNWCNNSITISGSKEKMKPIVEKLRFIINKDENVMGTLLGSGEPSNGDWYHHNLATFGTKWDFPLNEDFHYEIEDDLVYMTPDTAWSPPIDFLISLCEKYDVSAEIVFAEPGCDFAGKVEIDSSGITFDDTLSYMEGSFKYFDFFWEDLYMFAESAIDNDESLEQFVEEYKFVGEDYIDRIKETYNSIKNESN